MAERPDRGPDLVGRPFGELLARVRAQLDRKTLLLLLCAACLPVVYVYQGTPGFYLRHLDPDGGGARAAIFAQLYRFAAVFVLFFVLPAAAYRGVGGRLGDLGLRLGRWRAGLKLTALALAVAVPALWVNSAAPDMQAEYPMAREAMATAGWAVLYQLTYALYYWGWEFLFRGALQLGLLPGLGPVGALMVQLLPSVLLHIGKPVGETWGAVVAGPLLGAAAIRTGSILYVFVFHYAIGVVNDLFCAVRLGLL